MAIVNLNIAPYFDDYDPQKDYLRVLFRPGYPVQARELTTAQTILQEQIARLGNHIFKDGSRVTGASINVDNESTRLQMVGAGDANFPTSGRSERLAPLQDFVGLIVSNIDNTIRARVLALPNGVSGNSQLGPLYIKYITTPTFTNPISQTDPITSGYLFARMEDNPDLAADIFNVFNAVSPCTLANILEGVYYVGGEFIRVAEQTVVVSDTTNAATAALGFAVAPAFVSANEDSTLYDNARNSPNEGAPGANRLKVNLLFSIRGVDDTSDPSFYRIVVIVNGVIQENKTINPQYAELVNTLARRTYDESGDYALAPFIATVKDGTVEDQFIFSLGPSKAYVRGYEVEKISSTNLVIDRGLDTRSFGPPADWSPGSPYLSVSVPGPSYIRVQNVAGVLPGFSGSTNEVGLAFNALTLRNNNATAIGTARAWAFDAEGSNLYMFDVNMYQVLTVNSSIGLAVGNDLYDTTGNSGHVVAISANFVTIANASTSLVPGTLSSMSSRYTGTLVSTSGNYTFSDVVTITSAGSFSATVVTGATLQNASTPLVYPFDVEMKTTNGPNGQPVDNLFNIIQPASGNEYVPQNDRWSNTQNGAWVNNINIPAIASTGKVLNFAMLRIRNTAADSENYRFNVGANYGWSASDTNISLYYPDVQNVYGVVRANMAYASDSDSDKINSRAHILPSFTVVNMFSAVGAIPVGYVLRGQISGATAVVTATNTSTAAATYSLIGLNGWHEIISPTTGSNERLQIIYTSNATFIPNEEIVATAQSDDEDLEVLNFTFIGVQTESDPDAAGTFMIDNGQRDEYYDTARLISKSDMPSMGGDLLVFFSYFTTDSAITFYNVDSYASSGFFDNDVRYYTDAQTITSLDPLSGQNLRNTLDFRKRITPTWNYAQNSFIPTLRSYAAQAHITPNSSFAFSGEEYLPRIDTIALNKEGNFVHTKGVASVTPRKTPNDPSVMTLNYINIPAAVRYPTRQVTFETLDNRRYTMRDIGLLDTRITSLEKTISLNRLEIQALADQFVSTTGAPVFKLGFLVDDFSTPDVFNGRTNDNLIRDYTSNEYNASIDVIDQSMYATTLSMPINMIADIANSTGIDPHYLNRNVTTGEKIDPKRGSYIVKQYNETPLFGGNWQRQASETIRVNPYASWVYQGQLILDPKQDFWFEREFNATTVRIPPLPSTTVNGMKVVDINNPVVRQYSGMLLNIPGQPSRIEEITWNGLPTNPTTVEEVEISTGRGFSSRSTQRTATRTSVTGTRLPAPAIQTPVMIVNGREVRPAPQDSFMRSFDQMQPQRGIKFTATQMRPNTTLSAQFDGDDVTSMCFQYNADGTLGAPGVLVTNNEGTIEGIFQIPARRFNVGTRPLTLRDIEGAFTTFASANFSSAGTIERVDQTNYTFSETEPFTLAQNINRTGIVETTTERFDPVAQLFTLPLSEGLDANTDEPGAFITSVDVYFAYVDTRSALLDFVNVQIRNTDNGYPGPQVLGRGTVRLTAANGSTDASVATNIRLDEPCYLQHNTEYALVLLSPSDTTTVWIARQGGTDVTPGPARGGRISQQPNVGGYYGSFFTSQNNSTWNADQNADLKFNIYRAEFVTTPSTLRLVNRRTDSDASWVYPGAEDPNRIDNALEVFQNCKYMRIYSQNHGMYASGGLLSIFLDGVAPTSGDTVTGNFNGIPLQYLNGKQFRVRFPTVDTFLIDLTENAPGLEVGNIIPGTGGGRQVRITQCRQYSAITSNLQAVNWASTRLNMTLQTIVGATVSFKADSESRTVIYDNPSDVFNVSSDNCTVDEYCIFETPRILLNGINRSPRSGVPRNSITANIQLINDNSLLSPVIPYDSANTFMARRSNIIQVPDDSEINAILTTTSIPFDQAATTLQEEFASYITAVQAVSENATYVTKVVDLIATGTGINVMFDADMEPGTAIEFSYKSRAPGVNTPFNEIGWVEFPSNTFINETNYGNFESASVFNTYQIMVDTPAYSSFQVRLRMRSPNEAQVPKVKNLRITAVTT